MGKKQPRERSCFTIHPTLVSELKKIHDEHKDIYKRLRSDMVDTGILIALKLVRTYGPGWFNDNKEILPKAIIDQLEKKR